MTGTRRASSWALIASTLALFGIARTAHADGVEAHGESYRRTAVGLGVVTAGVGLAGRRAGFPAVPVTSGELVVSGIPSGATVVQAYLYWVTYAAAGDPDVTFDAMSVTGLAIGSSANTCWNAPFDVFENHVFRADVTTRVDGNGSYGIADFPSGLPAADTQGAALVVVFEDPADDRVGTFVLRDGAMTLRPGASPSVTFDGVTVPEGLASASWHMGVGDGEGVGLDGLLTFDDEGVPAADGIQHWRSTAGFFWDVVTYDVEPYLVPGSTDVAWAQTFRQDCVVYAFGGLELHTEAGIGLDAGTPDGGMPPDASSPLDAAALDGGATPDAGRFDAGPRDAGSSTPVGSGGCGCRAVRVEPRAGWLIAVLTVGLLVGRRRQR